jgi:hypothetical protein
MTMPERYFEILTLTQRKATLEEAKKTKRNSNNNNSIQKRKRENIKKISEKCLFAKVAISSDLDPEEKSPVCQRGDISGDFNVFRCRNTAEYFCSFGTCNSRASLLWMG